MILIDYSGLAIGNAMANLYKEIQNPSAQNIDMIRHMILNSIRSISAKFKDEYGPIVIACDSRSYWRRDVFPYYKANRKKSREKSSIDWKHLFECISTVKQELRDYFPYRVVEVMGAEADDVIACVTKEFSTNDKLFKVEGLLSTPEPILIVAEDSDYFQLHKYPNVDQWSTKHKKYITLRDPSLVAFHLHEKLICGETGDGVPNILSDDDTFVVESKRQKPVRKTLVESTHKNGIPGELQNNYNRNKTMIDFDMIPDHIHSSIINELKTKPAGSKSKMFNFFIEKQLIRHLDDINDF